MDDRIALIIGNDAYIEPRFARLAAPPGDVQTLAGVLSDPNIGGFTTVIPLLNPTLMEARQAIAALFAPHRAVGDLLVLYFSGHGVVDETRAFYLAMHDTRLGDALLATGLEGRWISAAMDRCPSRRMLLILDCCSSGSFPSGMQAKGAESPGAAGLGQVFEGSGYGRIVLTASDALQPAYELPAIQAAGPASVFTQWFVQGLRSGQADQDQDGLVTVDELYDFVFEHMGSARAWQIPQHWNYHQSGRFVLARNPFYAAPTQRLRLARVTTGGQEPLIDTADRLVTLGRAPANAVQLNDPSVSWEHGQIILQQGRYFYHHLSRTNPTDIEHSNRAVRLAAGQDATELLEQGDLLVVGSYRLRVDLASPQPDPAYVPTDPVPNEAS